MTLPTTPSFRLDGRRALVTGAGRGIGLAAAAALADAGAHVTLVARSGEEVEAGAAAIRAGGGSADAQACDVTDLDSFARLVANGDPYDVFFNNAGMNRPQPFAEVSVLNFDTIMGLNVRAAFFAAQAVARRLLSTQKPGSIINTSSQMGHVGAAGRSVYNASKFAVEGFTKAMAIELGPHRIRVNTICPTFIETPMTRPFLADEAFMQSVVAEDQDRAARPGRGPDGRDPLPRFRRLGHDDGLGADDRRRLDRGVSHDGRRKPDPDRPHPDGRLRALRGDPRPQGLLRRGDDGLPRPHRAPQPEGQRHRLAAGSRPLAGARHASATTSLRAASIAAGCTASRRPSRIWPRPPASR